MALDTATSSLVRNQFVMGEGVDLLNNLKTISPEQAQEILDTCNVANPRPINARNVKAIEGDLRNDRWEPNHQAVAFVYSIQHKCWILADGQHRLQACVNSGVPLRTLVVFGKDFSTMSVDKGKVRTTADTLRGMGEEDGAALSAVIGDVLRLALNNYSEGQAKLPSTAAIKAFLDNNPKIRSYQEMAQVIRGSRVSANKVAAVLFVSCELTEGRLTGPQADERSKELCLSFIEGLSTSEDQDARSPMYALRRRMEEYGVHKGTLSGKNAIALIIKAWKFHINGETTGPLRLPKTGKDFPEVPPCP